MLSTGALLPDLPLLSVALALCCLLEHFCRYNYCRCLWPLLQVTLLGLWMMPALFSLQLKFYRFVVVSKGMGWHLRATGGEEPELLAKDILAEHCWRSTC